MVKSLIVNVAKFIMLALSAYVLQKIVGPETNGRNSDHYANQKNPNSPAFHAARNNRANQMNPNNPAYSKSRANSQR